MSLPFLITVGAVASWALLAVVSRIVLMQFDIDPWLFSFVQLCAGGLALLLCSGRSALRLSGFLCGSTWVLGMFRVVSAALYTSVLVWLSVMEAGTLGAITVPMTAIAVWGVFGRRPAPGEWRGDLMVMAGVLVLVTVLDPGIRVRVIWLMGLNAVCVVAMTILAERHPDNMSSVPGTRLRFTGTVLLITAGLFLALRMGQGGPVAPLTSGPVLVIAGLVGVTLRAPSMVLTFWSIRLVGAQTYMVAVSFLPVFGMALEQGAVGLGWLAVSRFQMPVLGLALGVVAGSLMVLHARARMTTDA